MSNQRRLQLDGVSTGGKIIVEYVPATTPEPPEVLPPDKQRDPDDKPASPGESSGFNIATVRKLLTEAFDDVDLREICQDYRELRPVTNRLTRGMEKRQIVGELLDFCIQYDLLPKLIQITEQRNRTKFWLFQPHLWDRSEE